MLCITNYFLTFICLYTVKWSNRSISNNSIYHLSFVYSQLKYQTVLFDPLIGPYQISISSLRGLWSKVLRIPQSSSITVASPTDFFFFFGHTQNTCWISLTPLQRCSRCILQPQLFGLYISVSKVFGSWIVTRSHKCLLEIIIIIILPIVSFSRHHLITSEWQRVSFGLQDSFQDSGRSQQCCSIFMVLILPLISKPLRVVPTSTSLSFRFLWFSRGGPPGRQSPL